VRRWNQPHRKRARQEKAIDMMETQIGLLTHIRGDIPKEERYEAIAKIKTVIVNTKTNMR
tara:strand:- start:317 stop:496 length:180 start_codon:yes stop_codon:yes gene_type:complete